jgi:hypothetical protein
VNGQGLAATAPRILGREPVEAKIGVVGALLLGEQDRKSVLLGGAGPAGTEVVAAGGLRAAVEDDDERRSVWKRRRNIGPRR